MWPGYIYIYIYIIHHKKDGRGVVSIIWIPPLALVAITFNINFFLNLNNLSK